MTSPGGDGPDGEDRDRDARERPPDGPGPHSPSDESVSPPPGGSTDAWSRRPAGADASPGPEEGPGGPFPSWGALYTTVVVWMVGLILLLWLFTVTLRVEIGG